MFLAYDMSNLGSLKGKKMIGRRKEKRKKKFKNNFFFYFFGKKKKIGSTLLTWHSTSATSCQVNGKTDGSGRNADVSTR